MVSSAEHHTQKKNALFVQNLYKSVLNLYKNILLLLTEEKKEQI